MLETKILKKESKQLGEKDQLIVEFTYEADHLCWSCIKARDESCAVYTTLIEIIEDNDPEIEIGFFISRCKFYQKDPENPF